MIESILSRRVPLHVLKQVHVDLGRRQPGVPQRARQTASHALFTLRGSKAVPTFDVNTRPSFSQTFDSIRIFRCSAWWARSASTATCGIGTSARDPWVSGAQVVGWTYGGTSHPHQYWGLDYYVSSPEAYVFNWKSDLVLQPTSVSAGNPVLQQVWNDAAAQIWTVAT
jgi:hypothetical protein